MISLDSVFKYGFFLLLAGLVVSLMLRGSTDVDEQYLNTLHEKLEALEAEVTTLEATNSVLKDKIIVLEDSVVILDNRSQELENKRKAAIRYYEKRLRSIDNLTTHELDSIFAERYGFNGSSSEEDSN